MFHPIPRLCLATLACVTLTACGHADLMQAGPPPAAAGSSQPVAVRLTKQGEGYALVRGGKPYFIKGGGGSASQTLLRASGGNSVRTWGVDNLQPILDDAQKAGLTITAGIWLGHKDNGFDYHNPQQVAAQYEAARQAILRYRNSPALLVWGIGNEMEAGQQDDPAVWKAVDDIAALAKKLDPNHPTMTVVAEIGGDKVAQINAHCPDIDIIGINSYGGAASVPKRYEAAGGVKPYIITEFGPAGTWEIPKNSWGAANELTSTEKARSYQNAYEGAVIGQPLCLGSYAFLWGNKEEATPTWFGMLLPDGSKLAAVDTMTALWTGKPAAHPCPVIRSLAVPGADHVAPGATLHAALDMTSPGGGPVQVEWVLRSDPMAVPAGGGPEQAARSFPASIVQSTPHSAEVRMPDGSGAYRLYVYIHGPDKSAAVANVPLFVTGSQALTLAPGHKASLPLAVYSEANASSPAYMPTGYMGSTGAIKMNPASTVDPHAGHTCLQVDFTATQGWGGVVWQTPANDWGDLPGGWDLQGAKTLSFWARGAQGGEVVSFKFGLLGKEKGYPDTGSGSLEGVTLSKDWKQYQINLAGLDLSRIKTGFAWVVASPGHPVTFYLDDVRYE